MVGLAKWVLNRLQISYRWIVLQAAGSFGRYLSDLNGDVSIVDGREQNGRISYFVDETLIKRVQDYSTRLIIFG